MSRICDISCGVSTPPMWHMILAVGAGFLARQDGAPERLEAVLGDHVLRHAHLGAECDVGVLADRPGAGIDLREIDVVELGDRERREARVGDVDERIEPRARLPDDVAAERREVVGAGVAARHAGGGALMRHQFVGRNADRRAIGKDMRMKIDQAGRHQLAGDVEQALGARRRNVGFERLDHAEADADVALAAQVLARVEHVAALDDQIELVVRSHRGERRRAGERGRGAAEKITA